MGITNRITLAIMAAGLCIPALAQDKPVHVKMIRIIDGDTTIIEKDMSDKDLEEFQKERPAVNGRNVSTQMFIERKGNPGERMKESERFFFFNDSINGNCKMTRKNMIIDSLAPGMRFHFYDSALPPGFDPADMRKELRFTMDTMLVKELRTMNDEMFIFTDSLRKNMEGQVGYSFSISDTDGEVVVKQFGPEGEKVVVKKLDGKPGEELNEDIVIKSKDGKTVTRVMVRTTVKIEDAEPANEKAAPKKEKNELKLEGLNFYPNPNNGRFTIDFEAEGKQPVIIRINDMNGKEVYREEVKPNGRHSAQVDITSEGKGTYILNLQQGKKSTSKKIVIE